MTSRIFIYNTTVATFKLSDIDNNRYPMIMGGQTFSLRLGYHNNYETQYTLSLSTGQSIYFWLDVFGTITRTNTASGIALMGLGNQGDTIFPLEPTNYITIMPNGNSLPLAPSSIFPMFPVALLRSNDY